MPAPRPAEVTARLRTDLLRHAQAIVHRDGADALTMRALAIEAGCAVGLPYKVFTDREEIVIELVLLELTSLVSAFAAWLEQSPDHSVGENLDRYASIILDSRTALFDAAAIDQDLLEARLDTATRESGFAASLDATVADYLRLEQERGRVRKDIDADAFSFLITGAVHNLVVAGKAYPRPSRSELTTFVGLIADAMSPRDT